MGGGKGQTIIVVCVRHLIFFFLPYLILRNVKKVSQNQMELEFFGYHRGVDVRKGDGCCDVCGMVTIAQVVKPK